MYAAALPIAAFVIMPVDVSSGSGRRLEQGRYFRVIPEQVFRPAGFRKRGKMAEDDRTLVFSRRIGEGLLQPFTLIRTHSSVPCLRIRRTALFQSIENRRAANCMNIRSRPTARDADVHAIEHHEAPRTSREVVPRSPHAEAREKVFTRNDEVMVPEHEVARSRYFRPDGQDPIEAGSILVYKISEMNDKFRTLTIQRGRALVQFCGRIAVGSRSDRLMIRILHVGDHSEGKQRLLGVNRRCEREEQVQSVSHRLA
jgi:hypothetical protein